MKLYKIIAWLLICLKKSVGGSQRLSSLWCVITRMIVVNLSLKKQVSPIEFCLNLIQAKYSIHNTRLHEDCSSQKRVHNTWSRFKQLEMKPSMPLGSAFSCSVSNPLFDPKMDLIELSLLIISASIRNLQVVKAF